MRKATWEHMTLMAAALAIALLAANGARAALGLDTVDDADIARRPLTTAPSFRVQRAYGPDDEDCIYLTHKVRTANGTLDTRRDLICTR